MGSGDGVSTSLRRVERSFKSIHRSTRTNKFPQSLASDSACQKAIQIILPRPPCTEKYFNHLRKRSFVALQLCGLAPSIKRLNLEILPRFLFYAISYDFGSRVDSSFTRNLAAFLIVGNLSKLDALEEVFFYGIYDLSARLDHSLTT